MCLVRLVGLTRLVGLQCLMGLVNNRTAYLHIRHGMWSAFRKKGGKIVKCYGWCWKTNPEKNIHQTKKFVLLSIFTIVSIVWQQMSKLIDSIRSCTDTTNKRKTKIFLWFIDLKFRLWPKKQKGLWLSKEKHCCHNGLQSPEKRHSYKKCFILPEVDWKIKPNFIVLVMFTRLDNVQIHLNMK